MTVTHDISRFTKARVFAEVGKQTPLFMRFSTVAGERGAADAERDVRGFSVKFYTEEGNWDLVGNNTPVFFIRDPLKFPDFIHTQKRDPQTNLRNPVAVWDFWSRHPESLHQVTILMSDRGIPQNYRQMHGFGSHTYSLINANNERFWVKFHFKSMQGIANYTNEEAGQVVASDRESAQRDLFNSIAQGNFPKWKVRIQVMLPELMPQIYPINPFDVTKVWPHKDYPLIDVGVLELNRNPANYFADVEQAAFTPANVVPGIGYSPDHLLQGRLFSYGDAQRYRLGVNHAYIPVNAARSPSHAPHRDGAMRTDGNLGGTVNYEPNRFGEFAQARPAAQPPLPVKAVRSATTITAKTATTPASRPLCSACSTAQRQRFFNNIASAMQGLPEEIVACQLEHFRKVDPAYAAGVEIALGRNVR